MAAATFFGSLERTQSMAGLPKIKNNVITSRNCPNGVVKNSAMLMNVFHTNNPHSWSCTIRATNPAKNKKNPVITTHLLTPQHQAHVSNPQQHDLKQHDLSVHWQLTKCQHSVNPIAHSCFPYARFGFSAPSSSESSSFGFLSLLQ